MQANPAADEVKAQVVDNVPKSNVSGAGGEVRQLTQCRILVPEIRDSVSAFCSLVVTC